MKFDFKLLIVVFTLFNFVHNVTLRRKKLIEKYAQKIIKHFDIQNLLAADNYFQNDAQLRRPTPKPETDQDQIGCDSLEEIKGYFFDVYSSDSKAFNLSTNDLENLIEYLVKRYPKDEILQNKTRYNKCHRKKCFQSNDISKLTRSNIIDYEKFSEICPVLLFNFEIGYCELDRDDEGLSGTQIWIFGFLLSSVVTLWSWGGAIVFPIIGRKIYKRMLTFMISLAFGCLTSNGILKYIPLADGFEIAYLEETNHSYFYKHLIILFVIFFFFMFERTMKIFTIYKTQESNDSNKLTENNESTTSLHSLPRQISESESINMDNISTYSNISNRTKSAAERKKQFKKKKQSIDLGEIQIMGISRLNEVTDKLADRLKSIIEEDESENEINILDQKKKPKRLCCTSLSKGMSNVKPVGWMAIFGDGLGNFIDGLSIGASINQSLLLGLTTALATWCGNIPQELGDFALLVRAGMSPFQALFYNFCSGNSVYLGCIIGIIFGSNIEAARWIFSISGATTMFLGLAVLLPEMNEEFEDSKEPLKEKLKITFIQVFGVLFGYWIMIILNMYEDDITL